MFDGGFRVFKVDESNISLVENNPLTRGMIREKLAEGIYLLNLPAGTDISTFIEESSLDFMGNVKTSVTKSEYSTFPLLRAGRKPMILEAQNKKETKKTSIAEAGKILPRRITGTCAEHQRMLSKAIKRAREAALISYVND